MLPAIRKKSAFPSFVDEFFGGDLLPRFFVENDNSMNVPAVNIKEGKDDFKIEVAAPGLDKNDFKIDLDNNVLTVSSEKENKVEEDHDRFMRKEFSYSRFSRSFSLPESVDAEKISASHKDGILTILVPKKEQARIKPAKQIKIN